MHTNSSPLPRSSFKWPHFPNMSKPSNAIPTEVYDELVRYTKYASAAYQNICPRPMGNVLVTQFKDIITTTKGLIARDDARDELVISFRGSREIPSVIIDTSIVLSQLSGPGLPEDTHAHVHTGFLRAFRSIGALVLDALREQREKYPEYDVAVCGHSLGGSIASIAALSIANSFPGIALRLFTFGQPRTGNEAFANLVETMVGVDNIFRCVHTSDGVPTMIPRKLGYMHHATEYWQYAEPPVPGHIRRCVGGEDPEGSASIPSTGINLAHLVYFDQAIATDPTVCI